MTRVLSVVGARPQFVKLAPIAAEFSRRGIDHVIVHTGQHYDTAMSGAFFTELRISEPDVNLGIGSGPHGAQTGAMLAELEPVLEASAPDWVLVYGDTNSTIAAALCAVKLHLPLAHLEAGLRSFNRKMPEEHNRVLTDHCADLCLAPTRTAVDNLANEGLADRSQLVGDVMVDTLISIRDRATAVRDDEFVLATLHRAENVDDGARLAALIAALAATPIPVVLPVHPRLAHRAEQFGVDLDQGALRPCRPLPYFQMVATVAAAASVVTDSGGLQKEAFILGIPTTTVRNETEWVETLADGWNVLTPNLNDLQETLARARPTADRARPFGDGRAAAAVADCLQSPESRSDAIH